MTATLLRIQERISALEEAKHLSDVAHDEKNRDLQAALAASQFQNRRLEEKINRLQLQVQGVTGRLDEVEYFVANQPDDSAPVISPPQQSVNLPWPHQAFAGEQHIPQDAQRGVMDDSDDQEASITIPTQGAFRDPFAVSAVKGLSDEIVQPPVDSFLHGKMGMHKSNPRHVPFQPFYGEVPNEEMGGGEIAEQLSDGGNLILNPLIESTPPSTTHWHILTPPLPSRKVSILERRLSETEEKVLSLATGLEKIQITLSNYMASNQGMQTSLEPLTEKLGGVTQRLDNITMDVELAWLKGDVATVEEEMKPLKPRLEALEDRLSMEVTSLTTSISAGNREVQEALLAQRSELEKEIVKIKGVMIPQDEHGEVVGRVRRLEKVVYDLGEVFVGAAEGAKRKKVGS